MLIKYRAAPLNDGVNLPKLYANAPHTKPHVALSCSALTSGLSQSELSKAASAAHCRSLTHLVLLNLLIVTQAQRSNGHLVQINKAAKARIPRVKLLGPLAGQGVRSTRMGAKH